MGGGCKVGGGSDESVSGGVGGGEGDESSDSQVRGW